MLPVAAALFSIVFSAPPPEAVRRALDDVMQDPAIQRRLPGEKEGAAAGPWDPEAGRRAWERRRLRRGDADGDAEAQRPDRRRESGGGGGGGILGVGKVLFWVLVVAGALLVLFWATRALTGYSPDVPARAAAPAADPSARVLGGPLNAAEDLARRGEYGEAVHALLLLTLEEIAQRAEGGVPPTLTSREVQRRIAMSGAARRALGGLVRAVETSLFGGLQPDESVYRACLDHFGQFAAAYGGDAGAVPAVSA